MNSRQLALMVLRDIYQRGAYTDIALDRMLNKAEINSLDRALVTELVYGIVRRQITLDALINQLSHKKTSKQNPDLRLILQLGLYQLRYLNQIPESAAVNTSVQLAKEHKLGKLSGVVNGILRQYIRLRQSGEDPLKLPTDFVASLAIFYSFPQWIIELWLEQFGQEETEQLCQWFNQPAKIDLRINSLKTSLEEVESAFSQAGILVEHLPYLPQGLRLIEGGKNIRQLPGFTQGWWTIQDGSAQLVTHLLEPQPGEVIIDACAAPGGKTTHIAEMIQDKGIVWAIEPVASRLRKLEENKQRLGLNSIRICAGDIRELGQFKQTADRVLLDAPCSGLGTLHKRPDIRMRQTPARMEELSRLQTELLKGAATWVKPKGILVYSTCTLNSEENERVIENFLSQNPHWQIQAPIPSSPLADLATTSGWIKILPHKHQMDGFFMVRLMRYT